MDLRLLNRISLIGTSSHEIMVVIFSFSMVFNYCYIAQLVDPNVPKDNAFITTIYMIETFINVLNSLVLIFNFYQNYKYRNIFKVTQVRDKALLFFVFIPTAILSVIGKSIFAISKFSANLGTMSEIISVVSLFVLIVLIVSFVVHLKSHYDYGEMWDLNMIHMISLELTIMNMLSHLLSTVGTDQAQIFFRQINITNEAMQDIVNHKSGTFAVQIMWQTLSSFTYKSEIICYIVCIALLVQPLKRNYKFIQQYKTRAPEEFEYVPPDMERFEFLGRYLRLPLIVASVPVVLGVVIIMMSNMTQMTKRLYLGILSSILYLLSMVCMYCMYSEMKQARFKTRSNFLRKCLLWLGVLGQYVESISSIQKVIGSTDSQVIIHYVLLALQCLLQNILIIFFSEKNVKIRNRGFKNALLSFPCYLVLLNLFCIVLTVYFLLSPLPKNLSEILFIKLFENGFHKIGVVFAYLHRYYTAVVLLDYFRF